MGSTHLNQSSFVPVIASAETAARPTKRQKRRMAGAATAELIHFLRVSELATRDASTRSFVRISTLSTPQNMNRTPQNERRMRSPLGVVSPNVPSNPASGAPKIGGSAVAALCAELVAPPHVGTHSRALAQLNHALQGSPGLARAHRSELLRLLPSVVAGPVHHDAAAICALLRGVLVHCGEAGGDAALDAALAASLTWLWSQPEARLLESVHAVLLRAHPQVAQRALALLLRCAAGGAAAACSEAQLLCAVQGVELVFAMWSDAALTGHARTLADALVAFASVGGGVRVEEAWGRALQAAQQRGVSQPHGEWATLARSVAHACAHHPAARALVAADPIPLSTEAVAAAATCSI